MFTSRNGFFCSAFLINAVFAQNDLVDIKSINSNILIDIKYATENNFTKKKVYTQAKCYLRKEVAQKLSKVQKELEAMGLGLKIWDGYRPHSVQFIFWKLVPDERYVANPAKGSRHNRGAAVDLTLVDKNGKELEMPTALDDFTEKAHSDYKNLSEEVLKNRKLLQNVMTKHGFVILPTEWWHFDDCNWTKFDILKIPLEEL